MSARTDVGDRRGDVGDREGAVGADAAGVGRGAASAFLDDPLAPRRRPTREVLVGDVGIGGANPIRVQSMTTTDTLDTKATADEAERLADAGCEIVRVTAPSIRDAENLEAIAAELRRRRVHVPLVADIHFTPNAALVAAEYVHKVRVNPGNYADKKKFEVREYSDAQYEEELERVAERFTPLVRRCRELGRAMRIGTNHGSLSDRIMNRYGDTPLGMVESALEFLDVCEAEGYRDVVFSMKASNAQVAIQAYRLLAARLGARSAESGEPDYPFHVGVTEAGDGEDGRVKSAIGIGALLEDGIGDTVRVSLTEDPVKEVPVARALVQRAERLWEASERVRAAASPTPSAPRVLGGRPVRARAAPLDARPPERARYRGGRAGPGRARALARAGQPGWPGGRAGDVARDARRGRMREPVRSRRVSAAGGPAARARGAAHLAGAHAPARAATSRRARGKPAERDGCAGRTGRGRAASHGGHRRRGARGAGGGRPARRVVSVL